jgi:hypothetical protein
MTPTARYPTCSICGEPLLPDSRPVLDDGSVYHSACMQERVDESSRNGKASAGPS